MNTSLTTYFKYPSELRSRKRKLSPERGVLADITNSTPKRYAVSISNRSTGITKQFTRMDTMNKREVCAVFVMQLKGNHVYLNTKSAFFGARRPLDPSFASSSLIFHFHFLSLLSAPCIPHPVHNTTFVALVHQSSNPYFPYMMQQFFPHTLLFLDYPEFGSSHLFLNVSNCLQLT